MSHNSSYQINQVLVDKWKGVIDVEGLPPIKDPWVRGGLAQMIENTVEEMKSQRGFAPLSLFEDSPTNNFGGGQVQFQDPILITMLRRSMPNLMAYDVAGVQPMSGPTGLIFALRALYSNNAGNEAFYNEPNTQFSSITAGANTLGDKHVGTLPGNSTTGTANLAETGIYNYGDAMTTTQLESIGTSGNNAFPEMAFTIDRMSVSPGGRALKAQYSVELAHDLQKTHGMDAEKLLSEILSTEIVADINRELIRTINVTAARGATSGTTTVGRFDLDVDSGGRWLGEKLKGLCFFLDLEANQVAKDTRRGKANIIICSSNVASALQMAGVLDYTPALNNEGLAVDDTGNTFAGIAMKRYRVYVDPYAGGNYLTLGYKGTGPMDAGIYYCPYVPLTMSRALDPSSHQPNIAFKTRYAMAQNPFSKGIQNGAVGSMSIALTKDSNLYFRRILIDNIL
jgi:major capsid protein Gp23